MNIITSNNSFTFWYKKSHTYTTLQLFSVCWQPVFMMVVILKCVHNGRAVQLIELSTLTCLVWLPLSPTTHTHAFIWTFWLSLASITLCRSVVSALWRLCLHHMEQSQSNSLSHVQISWITCIQRILFTIFYLTWYYRNL